MSPIQCPENITSLILAIIGRRPFWCRDYVPLSSSDRDWNSSRSQALFTKSRSAITMATGGTPRRVLVWGARTHTSTRASLGAHRDVHAMHLHMQLWGGAERPPPGVRRPTRGAFSSLWPILEKPLQIISQWACVVTASLMQPRAHLSR